MGLRRWCAIALWAMAWSCAADETRLLQAPDDGTCERAYAALPQGTLLDLLDPDAPADRREAALSAYQRLSSMRQCPEFAYTLGQLYRHGSGLPGNPLPQDVPKARELIRPMAEDGYLPAFADLAEMEMRHANAREAMLWTQVYLYFVRAEGGGPADTPEDRRYRNSAYNGNLLARTEQIWNRFLRPPLPRRTIREDLNAYLAEHGAAVQRRMREREQGMHLRASAQDGGPIRVVAHDEDCSVRLPGDLGAASAAWIVEVLPSGRTGRIVLESFVPTPKVAGPMAECLSRYRFAPFPGNAPATIRIPMVVGSREGAALRRPRRP